MDTTRMRTWAEISLENLEHNYRALRALLEPGCGFVGVVKADAYGHGALPIARKLEELGAEYLAVACLEEGAELRQGGVRAPILVLGLTPPEEVEEVLRWDLTQTVYEPALGEALSRAALALGVRAKVHLKVDTGMSRLGCPAYDRGACVAALGAIGELPGLEAEGIYTHFAAADGDEDYTRAQFERFTAVVEALEARRGRPFRFRHCAASAAVLNYPWTHLDLVRPGIALYGHSPDPSCQLPPMGLRPVMTLKTRVAAVRELPGGVGVSYGHTAWTGDGCRVAVLPIGYADGLPRLLSNRGTVELGGLPRPILGRVCMDMCMVRLEPGDEVRPGDAAVIYGPGEATVEKAAGLVGTIQYELLCAVSRRVPRVVTGA